MFCDLFFHHGLEDCSRFLELQFEGLNFAITSKSRFNRFKKYPKSYFLELGQDKDLTFIESSQMKDLTLLNLS